MGFAGDRLVASAIGDDCGTYRLSRPCYFEMDLATSEGRRIGYWTALELLESGN